MIFIKILQEMLKKGLTLKLSEEQTTAKRKKKVISVMKDEFGEKSLKNLLD